MESRYRILGPNRSTGTSLKPSPVQMFMVQTWPSSSARYWLMRMQARPCAIQKRRVPSLGEESVSGSQRGWKKTSG